MLLRAGGTTFSPMFSLRAPLDLCGDQRSQGAALTPLRLLVFLPAIVLLALATSTARAQVSAYGMVALTSYGFSYQNSSYDFPVDTAGLVGGAFYNFPIRSRLTAGIDGRVLYGPGSYGGATATGASALFPSVFASVPTSSLAVAWSVRVSTPGSPSNTLRMVRRS